MKVYVARPLGGHTFQDAMGYYEIVKKHLCGPGKFEVLCPLTAKGRLNGGEAIKLEGYSGIPALTDKAIFGLCKWMVRQADIVLVDLSLATATSIGCISELAWANILGKHTVVVMKKDNVHYHTFVLQNADIVLESMPEAFTYLHKVLRNEA